MNEVAKLTDAQVISTLAYYMNFYLGAVSAVRPELTSPDLMQYTRALTERSEALAKSLQGKGES